MYALYITLGDKMHRTQLYIEEDTFSQVQKLSKSLNISISEFIRTAVKNELKKETGQDISEFFDKLTPLASFKDIDSKKYVKDLRANSRIVND